MNNLSTYHATGSGALAYSLTQEESGYIRGLRLHLNAAGVAGDLTVKLDAMAGAVHDTLLLKRDMTLVTDLVWQPTAPIPFEPGDKILVDWLNAGAKTYGLEVIIG